MIFLREQWPYLCVVESNNLVGKLMYRHFYFQKILWDLWIQSFILFKFVWRLPSSALHWRRLWYAISAQRFHWQLQWGKREESPELLWNCCPKKIIWNLSQIFMTLSHRTLQGTWVCQRRSCERLSYNWRPGSDFAMDTWWSSLINDRAQN